VNCGLAKKLLIVILISLMIIPISSVGCRVDEKEPAAPTPPAVPEAPPPPPYPGELSSTLVPDTQLDLYAYIRQENPTLIPAEAVGAPHDVSVESLSIWGVPAEDDFAFGMGITFTKASDASGLYEQSDAWKKLSDNKVYLVQGSEVAAASLTTAISNNDFKHYDDEDGLKAVATLPDDGSTKMAGVIVAKPTEAVMSFIGGTEGSEMINLLLQLADIEVIAAGLYSPEQIDLTSMMGAMGDGGSFLQIDLGMVILIKSGRPGFLVEPIVTKMLSETGYTETSVGDVTVYSGSWDTGGGATPALIRVEGDHIFIAISEQESYIETLITSTKK